MSETRYIYIWEGAGECDECAEMVGTEFENEEEIDSMLPLHPNCNCYISVLEIDDDDNVKPTNKDFENIVKNTIQNEGGLTQNEGRLDFPTNMGITQSTLDSYNKMHPGFNFPQKVDDLKHEQAKQIYKTEYWDRGKFGKINNDRIREATFDMYVMSGPSIFGKQLQEALNDFGINVPVDGVIGSRTIGAINDIPKSEINNFVEMLKANRMKHLQNDDTQKWEENKSGWYKRTLKY